MIAGDDAFRVGRDMGERARVRMGKRGNDKLEMTIRTAGWKFT